MLQQYEPPLFDFSRASSPSARLPAESPAATVRSQRRIGFAPLPNDTSSPENSSSNSSAQLPLRSNGSEGSIEHFRAIDEKAHIVRSTSCTLPTPAASPYRHCASEDVGATGRAHTRSTSLSSDQSSPVRRVTVSARPLHPTVLEEFLLQNATSASLWEETETVSATPGGITESTYSSPTISPLACSPMGRRVSLVKSRQSPMTRKGLRPSLTSVVSSKRRFMLRLPSRRSSPQTTPGKFSPTTSEEEAPAATTRSVLWRRLKGDATSCPTAALISFDAAAAACGAAKTLGVLRGNGITARVVVMEGKTVVVAEAGVKLQLVKAKKAKGSSVEVAHEPLLMLESRRRGTKRGLVLDGERQPSRDPAVVLKMLEDMEPANSETEVTLSSLIAWARRGLFTRRSSASPPTVAAASAVTDDEDFYIAVVPVKNAASGAVLMLLHSDSEADDFCEALGVLQTYSQVYGCPTIAAAAAKAAV